MDTSGTGILWPIFTVIKFLLMAAIISTRNNDKKATYIFILSIACCAFWIAGNIFTVYKYALIGAIFEILWLPMLAMLFVLPVLCVIFLIKDKKYFKSYYLYALLLMGIAILFLFINNKNPA